MAVTVTRFPYLKSWLNRLFVARWVGFVNCNDGGMRQTIRGGRITNKNHPLMVTRFPYSKSRFNRLFVTRRVAFVNSYKWRDKLKHFAEQEE